MTARLYTAERIWTMDAHRPYVRHMAVENGRILAVGDEARALGCPEAVDLGGAAVLPGFIDAHVHFGDLARAKYELDLSEARSAEDVLARLQKHAATLTPGEWLFGRRWDESKWPERRYLTRDDLDRALPNVPVVLRRVCGHLWVANTCALERAQVPADTPGLDAANGWLREGATDGLKRYREPTPERLAQAIGYASDSVLRLGITSVHDQWSELRPLWEAPAGALRVKVRVGLPDTRLAAACELGLPTGLGSRFVCMGGIKVFADGSVGARTAALREPYADDPSTAGGLVCTPEALGERVRAAHQHGLQLAVHAIGDRAVDVVVDALRRAIESAPDRDHRHRIEHCELPDRAAVDALAALGVIASVQPNFIGEWGRAGGMYEERLGPDRWMRMNPLGTLVRAGVRLAFGSDGMPIGPLYGIWSATQHPDPAERLTVEQAVACYTAGSAWAGFEEAEKGRLQPGYAADFVVLSSDPARVPVDRIRDIRVLQTYVDGRRAFDATG
ncbi:MAG: amidohydrolase [Candidatus Brocadiaceae bacterium]|nr:amidohydrolase [Candidatus Brocadiaceae bacterium]